MLLLPARIVNVHDVYVIIKHTIDRLTNMFVGGTLKPAAGAAMHIYKWTKK